ncbi:MSHA biogenesis protein MshK [Noviherbaspirillum sp.]|uniref:MSHA biogenesis protein MshK n=1 Tax=Noviherbaspirillum sp. TaxID=1926288 RepID=UPI002FE0F913
MDTVKILLVPLGCMLLAVAPVAASSGLPDPTRPPSINHSSTGVDASGPVLQSVLIAPGRKEAVISGRTVKVGHQVGEARVEMIAESEVVLRNGKDVQVLKLFPGIEKKPATRLSSPKPAG